MSYEIKHGHVTDVLKGMPAGSVQCVVTSPPYWGLRAYGTEPQVWPSAEEDCEHVWADPMVGSGTTGAVALELGRLYIGIDLNAKDVAYTEKRLAAVMPLFD